MTPSKRVLVIAYYFPPMGLSGVQRVAGFVRHLPACGWKPTVLTTTPAGYYAYDESLLTPLEAANIKIHRTGSLDPTRLFKTRQIVSMPAENARQRMGSVSQWLFVPDNKVGWMPFAHHAARRLVGRAGFDAVLSSAPPYTAHLIGARISKKFGIPLVVDFRDDWIGNPRHTYPTSVHSSLHRRLERAVMKQCQTAICINPSISSALRGRNPHVSADISVIPHGYEADDESEPMSGRNDGKLQLLYTGIFYDAQTPDYLLRGVQRFLQRNRQVRLEVVFAGLVPKHSVQLVKELGLSDIVRLLGYLPHDQVSALQKQADVLWMTIGTRPGSAGISTGKLFEYMGRRKPILALIPPGTARNVLKKYQASFISNPEDVEAIAGALANIYTHWSTNTLPAPDESFVRTLTLKRLTERLAHILNDCTDSQASRVSQVTE